MDTGALHHLYNVSMVLILYQKFPFDMSSMTSDTVKIGRLLFDGNFVQQGIRLIIIYSIPNLKVCVKNLSFSIIHLFFGIVKDKRQTLRS